MSLQLKNVAYSPKALETAWANNIFSSHDLFCGCDDPVLHLLIIFNKRGNAPKPEKDIKNIKCLITGEPTTTKEDPGDIIEDFDGEDLEKLFTEDTEPKDTEDDSG